MDRRRFLTAGVHAGAALVTTGLLDTAARGQGASGLKEAAAACGMTVGVQVEKMPLSTSPALAQAVKSNFTLITPGNELKWGRLRPDPDTFAFADPDWMVNWALTNGLRVHGHNLCWNAPNTNPKWFDSVINRSNARDYLTRHISTVMKHYTGKIESWDVVNEPFVPWGKQGGLYPGVWLNLLGPQYIDVAFHAAAEADPKPLRILNLHHVENENEEDEKNRGQSIQLLKTYLGRGVPIQAVGIESHIDTSIATAGPGLLRFLRELQDLGLQTLITELDVNDARLSGADIALMDRTVAQSYYDYISGVVAAGHMNTVIFWTASDKWSWMNSVKSAQYQRTDNVKHRGGLFDENIRSKSALQSAASALQKACAGRGRSS